MRHIWNFWMKARGRPHKGQRECARALNFGFRVAFTIFEVFAISIPRLAQLRNGMPSDFRRAFPSLSFRAVVVMVTFMPFTFSTLS